MGMEKTPGRRRRELKAKQREERRWKSKNGTLKVYRSPAERLERRVADDVAWASEHHVKVRFDGLGYAAVCSCMWRGERHSSRAAADSDAAGHRV